ncbi:phage baseplate assembly protein domain-containing protein [Paraburkholderia tropica]|uniref:phage baseplate assembly protein domain-containing protein n=1 Tax=Paraburkholderia tropica TaxID=92647 RepID=UPI002AAFB975|nr:phage baseplate assembly protein [Paraburkholderia tropica]
MIDQLNRLARRVLLALARGTISLVDDTQSVQKLQVRVNALELIPDVPRVAEYGLTSNPPSGTLAVIGFKNGDRNDGIVIATSNAKYRMTGLATGEVAIHDDKGQSVYLSAAGIVVNGGGNPITMTNLSKLRVEAPIESTGDITDNVDTTGRSMAADRQIYDSHTHKFVAQSGSSNLVTASPTQQE